MPRHTDLASRGADENKHDATVVACPAAPPPFLQAEFVIFFAYKGIIGIQTPRPKPMTPRYIYEIGREAAGQAKQSSRVHPAAFPNRKR